MCPYWKTEIDMFDTDGIFNLTPSLMIDVEQRKEIIEYTKQNIKNYRTCQE